MEKRCELSDLAQGPRFPIRMSSPLQSREGHAGHVWTVCRGCWGSCWAGTTAPSPTWWRSRRMLGMAAGGVGRQGSCVPSRSNCRGLSPQTRGNLRRRWGGSEWRRRGVDHSWSVIFPSSYPIPRVRQPSANQPLRLFCARQPSSSRHADFWFCLRLVVVVR